MNAHILQHPDHDPTEDGIAQLLLDRGEIEKYELDRRDLALMAAVTGIDPGRHVPMSGKRPPEPRDIPVSVRELVVPMSAAVGGEPTVSRLETRRVFAVRKLVRYQLLQLCDEHGDTTNTEACEVELALGGGYVRATEAGRRAVIRTMAIEHFQYEWDRIAHDVTGNSKGEVGADVARDTMYGKSDDAPKIVRDYLKAMSWKERAEFFADAFPDGTTYYGSPGREE